MTWRALSSLLQHTLLFTLFVGVVVTDIALTGVVVAQPLRNQPPADATAPPASAPAPSDATAATEAETKAEETVADEEKGNTLEPVGGPRERMNKAELNAAMERVASLSLTGDEIKSAKKYYQDALQLATELDQQRKIIKDKERWYEPVPVVRDPEGPQQYTKDWFEKRLSLPMSHELNLRLTPIDLRNDTTEFLQEHATKREERATHWSKMVKLLEQAPAARKQFTNTLPTKRQDLEQQLTETTAAIEKIAADGIASEVTVARREMLVQREAKLVAEIAALETQKKAFEREQEVYDLELELAKRKADAYTEEVTRLRAEINNRRQQAATEQVQAAEQEADRNHQLIERNPDSLGALAATNQALTKELKELLSDQQRITAENDTDVKTDTAIATTFATFKSQYDDNSKLSQVSGQLLRDQRARLPRVSQLRAELLQRTSQQNDISFRRFEANQQLQDLADTNAQVAKLLEKTQPEDRAEAEPVLRSLLESKREYLTSDIKNLDLLEAELGTLIGTKDRLIANTEAFRAFIAERDLWIRNCHPLWASAAKTEGDQSGWRPFYWQPAKDALAWSLRPTNWIKTLEDIRAAAYRQPLLTAFLISALLLLLYAQRQSRKLIKTLGEEASKKTCIEFTPSLRTFWHTLVVSLPWPLLLWSVGWLIDGPLIESEFTRAMSQAAQLSAWLLLLTEFLRQSCRADGLADVHLGWPRTALLQLRRYLRWVPLFVVPLVFWQVGLDTQSTEPLWSASLGRVMFLLVQSYLILALWRMLLWRKSPIYQMLHRGSENWLLNLHTVWRPAVVMLPVALSVMALIGYFYTAEQLAQRVLETSAMVLGLMIAGGLLRRWVLLNRRKLAREQARQRRAQAAAAAADSEDNASEFADIPEETVDLTALSDQTRKLLRMLLLVGGAIGTILIWQEVFPALAWLDDNKLPWLKDSDSPTTWGHLIRAMLAIAITFVAVRDLPGLLELLVLQHLPIDSGSRYAIATLARYAILSIGIVIAASSLGITGTSIGWLVAAMGVGLGFGLQEIFANFVSGIILLFERPIRVGDIITLGDKTGVVNRIRMRATTITDWDRKEYVVPNKDLVTERLLNWTLSDQTNRITVTVGVAYGTDTDLTTDLLMQVVKSCPYVLEDTAPRVAFDMFGDSTLNFTVRCFLPDLEKRLDTIHFLHTGINKAFMAANIEIAFPQRDVHIRSVPAGWDTSSANSQNSNSNGHPASKANMDAM